MNSLRKHVRAGGVIRKIEATLRDGLISSAVTRLDEADAAAATPVQAHVARAGRNRIAIRMDDFTLHAVVIRRRQTTYVVLGGHTWEIADHDPGGPASDAVSDDPVARSPMTGKVVKVHVAKGDSCSKGAPLLVVEAMKMEYVVRAPRDVVVAEVTVEEGAQVSQDAELVRYAPDAETVDTSA